MSTKGSIKEGCIASIIPLIDPPLELLLFLVTLQYFALLHSELNFSSVYLDEFEMAFKCQLMKYIVGLAIGQGYDIEIMIVF